MSCRAVPQCAGKKIFGWTLAHVGHHILSARTTTNDVVSFFFFKYDISYFEGDHRQ